MSRGFLLPAPPVASLDDYLAGGGGRGLVRARELGPYQVIEEVNLWGLRGRGSAGFRTGTKWMSVQRGGPQRGRRRADHVQRPGLAARQPLPGDRGAGARGGGRRGTRGVRRRQG